MNRASHSTRELAERLIAFEAGQKESSDAIAPTAFPVAEKLRPHLTTFMGNAGFHALLMRALALAGAEMPWLREVQLSPTGSLTLPEELAEKGAGKTLLEGRVMLVAQLLGLMVAFIGEKLTLQLLLDVWPKLSSKDFNFSNEDPS
jgi:hypothetical protein